MTFAHPWILLFFPATVAWAAWERRKTDRRGGLALKMAFFCLVLSALAQPKLTAPEHRVGLAVLTDASASVPPEDVQRTTKLIAQIRAQQGSHSLDVIPFAGGIRSSDREEVRSRPVPDPETRATNLEAAMRDAISRLPESRVPRLLLISDGQENIGSVERAIYQARLLGIPVDTYALGGRRQPPMHLESVAVPSRAFAGEKFPIGLVVSSPRTLQVGAEITAEGRHIGGAKVDLAPGRNTLGVQVQLDAVGTTVVSGLIRGGELGEVRFDRVVSLRRPRLLLISPEPAAATRHLRQVLEAARFETVPSAGPLPESLNDYHVVLAVNHDPESWTAGEKNRIEQYVRSGGGFALIAGENNSYADHRRDDDPVQRMLPAVLTPPRLPEGNAVVLVVDKSFSMTGRKIELARRSAVGVVDNLRPVDLIGVLILDNTFQWAVDIRKADAPLFIKRMIAGITPDGGTNIAPALAEAYRQIRHTDAVYKHIVLLTDGISEEGNSMALAGEAAANHVTISTIGLGEDVNRAYLEKVAGLAKGKCYLLSEFQNLEELMLRDVEEHTGTSVVEKEVHVGVLRDVQMLDGVGMEKGPPLYGYLRFTAKPQAETILQVDDRDPLLVRWQYGLGRSIVFASDARARWAARWIEWPGYAHLWTNLLHDLLPRAHDAEASAEFDKSEGEIVVRYRFEPGADPGKPPDLYVLGPNGFRKTVFLERVSASSFQGSVPIGDNKGLFRIRPANESSRFPEVGFYREDAELTQYGSNTQLLRRIAEFTGGRFNPEPRQIFDAGNRSVATSMDLWPWLLMLAILLNVAELAERKGHLRLSLPRKRSG